MFSLLLRARRGIKRLLKVQSLNRRKEAPGIRSKALKYGMLAFFSIAIGVLYPGQSLFDPLDIPREGETAAEEITAPFQIVINKTERELRAEENEIKSNILHIVDHDSTVLPRILDSLALFIETVRGARNKFGESSYTSAQVDSIAAIFPDISLSAIRNSMDPAFNLENLLLTLSEIFQTEIYEAGVLRSVAALSDYRQRSIIFRRGEREMVLLKDKLLDLPLGNARLLTELNRRAPIDSFTVEDYYLIGRAFIEPDAFVNSDEYTERVGNELSVRSPVRETIYSGDIIVPIRGRVTERQENILREMVRLQRSHAVSEGWWVPYLPALARVVLVFAIFGGLFLFLNHFRQDIFYSNQKLLALLLVFVLQLSLVFVVNHAAEALSITSIYILPVAVLPVIVAILFDAEVGILSVVALAMLLGIMHRFSFPITLLTVVVGAFAAYSSHSVRKRAHAFRIMLLAVFGYFLVILIVESLRIGAHEELLGEMLYGFIIAVISVPLAIFLFLPFFESLFGFTTDIKLLELSDLNHPLLKRLAIEAPGTYHHSIIVSNLTEAAAKSIGGNPLLAQVGAYYHDIGKIEIPEYFVENQLGVKSKHESLSPSMSALVLVSHVKKGRQLGEEANIPDDVLNFIEEHHGTMVMSYFYNKALEMGADKNSMDEFRYPGPRPQTRETGIAMLADAVEASSRTLEDPKPARIDSLIQKIIDDRFKSGELDECPLTLKDLAKIKEAFAQILVAAFHHRVRYPKEQQPD
ncbi:MAG: HDIG domain-containing protein [candidate division Zixibacteria bacterium]|nr:HDIG domain-containing protein [candidate division Zixibacteria bacterium]